MVSMTGSLPDIKISIIGTGAGTYPKRIPGLGRCIPYINAVKFMINKQSKYRANGLLVLYYMIQYDTVINVWAPIRVLGPFFKNYKTPPSLAGRGVKLEPARGLEPLT